MDRHFEQMEVLSDIVDGSDREYSSDEVYFTELLPQRVHKIADTEGDSSSVCHIDG
jgi:hypothetical protein